MSASTLSVLDKINAINALAIRISEETPHTAHVGYAGHVHSLTVYIRAVDAVPGAFIFFRYIYLPGSTLEKCAGNELDQMIRDLAALLPKEAAA